MKTYKVSFYLDGHYTATTVTANSYQSAMAMVKSQYPSATHIAIQG
jgi:hypothetical protein